MSEPGIAQAYDAIAADYDRQVAADSWVRERLWQHYATVFQPGQHLLDLACGTGLDALFLARRGITVTGIDISPRMLEQLRRKADREGLGHHIETQVLDLGTLVNEPARLEGTRGLEFPYDGIISAFAGLNTLPDLRSFAATASRLLQPDGRMVLHMLNRWSLWEWLGLMARGQWTPARKVGSKPVRTFVIGSQPVRHYLYHPQELFHHSFAPYFQLQRAYGLGILRPPGDRAWAPASLVTTLSWLEGRCAARRPWLNWGRFFVLELIKR